jgi:hypothetical protein
MARRVRAALLPVLAVQAQRDAELERVLRRQNTRFTTMLIVAIVLSVAALTAVAMVGYLMVNRMH